MGKRMKEAMLYEKLDNFAVHCYLCAHQCVIQNKHLGYCRVRKNIDGKLFSLNYGKLIAENVDPVEKKPLYHFFPGTKSYSVASVGCNFRCGFCQNWQISQVSETDQFGNWRKDVTSYQIVEQAVRSGAKSIAFTYTEPTIFFEYAYETAKIAKEQGLYTIFVTNGYMSTKALDLINPFLDACNVDLKSFSEVFYRKICSAHLKPVLDNIKRLIENDIWVEITTLLIPGKNDSEDEIEQIVKFISSIDKDIPWHVSRFFPNYEFSDFNITPEPVIKNALDIASRYGLRYVYPGNIRSDRIDTFCYNCGKKIIKRSDGYMVGKIDLKDGKCPKCLKEIKGVWENKKE